MNPATTQLDGSFTRDSAFSYLCRACSRCCHGYRIRVNPFESLKLARHLRISTTEFTQRFLDADSTLKHKGNDGSCVFLSAKGCTVHPARPLACRLYPLGRSAGSDGDERFFPIAPHPQSAGVHGASGTVRQYLADQGAEEFIAAADRYLELFCRCISKLGTVSDRPFEAGPALSEYLDADITIAELWPGLDVRTLSAEDAMNLHIQAIETLLLNSQGNNYEQF
jgi:uncharacterized protein